ncbi:MAG: BlaI/MecI/CopY family transcriptional regulator [Bacteroidetes bacterium]|nr:BlaI/MecI/CopY family transcriptional regulator [Bacteroidota bacterium]
MELLTRTEEKVMLILWDMEKCLVKDIIDHLDPKPPYNTISSVVRLLENKEFVDHKAYGKTYEYFPKIEKHDYARFKLERLAEHYFHGSYSEMVRFVATEKDLHIDAIIEIDDNENAPKINYRDGYAF